MIGEARDGSREDEYFLIGRAEALPFRRCFDLVLCNSAFQWFEEPETAVDEMFRVLRPGGRVALQAPAEEEYSPTFVRAVQKVGEDPELGEVFEHFVSPWFFLETGEEYAEFFEGSGFEVDLSEVERVVALHGPDKVFDIFRSGAEAGYLDPGNYRDGSGFDEAYRQGFLKRVRGALDGMVSEDGEVELVFNRVFLLAEWPEI